MRMNSAEVYLSLVGKGGSPVKGDVEAQAYEGQIALYDWKWGLGLGEAKPGSKDDRSLESKEFSLSKAVDAASTTMMSLMHSGELCDKAILTMVQRSDAPIMLRIVLKKVRLMSFELTLESEDTEVVMGEDWILSFEEVEVLYRGARSKQDVRGTVADSALRANTSFTLKLPPGAEFQPLPVRSEAPDASDIARMVEEQVKRRMKS